MMPNLLQYPIAIFGVLRAGMTVVNTNPMYTARELKHQLEDSGAKAIVVLDNFAATLQQVATQTQVKHIRSEEHTSELQSLMRISYAVFCLKKKNKKSNKQQQTTTSSNQHKYTIKHYT